MDLTPQQQATTARIHELTDAPAWITLTVGVNNKAFRAMNGKPRMTKAAIAALAAEKVVDLIAHGDPEASPNPIFVRPERSITDLGGTVQLNPEKPFRHNRAEGSGEYRGYTLLDLHLLVTVDRELWTRYEQKPSRHGGNARDLSQHCQQLATNGRWAHDANVVDWIYISESHVERDGEKVTVTDSVRYADDTIVHPDGSRTLRDGTMEPFQG